MAPLNLHQLPIIRLGSLGLSFHVIPPVDIDLWGDHPLLPAGTLLLSTGSGGWAWAERFLVHSKTPEGYTVVDLQRGIAVEMSGWEIAASFARLLSQEAYPFKTLEEAQQAVRAGIPLFTPPLVAASV